MHFRDFAGWFFICCGAAIVIVLRIHGADMTEGQLLIRYMPLWVAAVVLLFGGAGILKVAGEIEG